MFRSLCECNFAPGRALEPHRRQTPWASVTESKRAPALTERRTCLAISFHVIDGQEILDTEGTVLAGEAEARTEAIVVSGEMLKDLGGTFWNNGEWQIRVEDDAGNKVCALTFSANRS